MRSIAVRTLVRTFAPLSVLLAAAATPALSQTIDPPFALRYRFSDGSSGNQANPTASLTRGRDGKLYGMTAAGGGAGAGSIFEFDPVGGTEAWTIHGFGNDQYDPGAQPSSGPLVQAADGSLFGTTVLGGDNGVGTLFRLDLLGSRRGVATLFSFPATAPYPDGGVILGSDGLLYGTVTGNGGTTRGAVFRIALDGSGFTVLHAFTGAADGGEPGTGLIEGLDGLLYGTTNGGTAGGTVFRLSRTGTGFEVLKTGVGPGVSNLVQATDGMLFGASREAGSASLVGSVFSLRPSDKQFTILHAFETSDAGGTKPEGRLVLGPAGKLYGFLGEDIASSQPFYGAIFRVAVDGSGYQVLHLFSQTDGMNPGAGLLMTDEGTLWGTTARGGTTATPDGDGVLFSLAGAAELPVVMRDGGGSGLDGGTAAGVELQVTLWLRNFSGLDAGGPLTVRVGSPLLQFIQGWSDAPDWSCSVAGIEGSCAWSGTLPSGQESAMLTLRFLTNSGPFTTACATSPTLGPCFYVNAVIEDRAATASFPVFVTTRDPVTGAFNKFPYAGDDSAEVFGTEPVTIRVLDNDSDADGASLILVGIETPPASGAATVNADNTITFTPIAPLTADDRFTYRIEDSDGAWSVGTVYLTPRTLALTLSKSRIDLGVVPVGRMAAGRAVLRGGPEGLPVSFRIEAIDPSEFPALLQGTGHDPNDAVSDPQAFSGYLGWRFSPADDLGPFCVPAIYFRPSANVGQVSLARVYLDALVSTGTVSTSVVVIGASGDPASIPPPRAADDAAATPVGVPIDIPVLTNDTGTSGRGLYISQNGGCPETVFDGTGCSGGGGAVGVVLSPITGLWEQIRFIPAPGFSGQASSYYSMSEIDACVNPRQPGCQYEGNMYFARVTVNVGGTPAYSLTISPAPAGGTVTGNGLTCGAGGAACAVTFASATTATLTATPASGYVFTSWGGACSGTSMTTSVLVDAVKACSATFTASGGGGGLPTGPPYTLTVTPPVGGQVRASGIRCGAGEALCSVTMPAALSVGLEAVPSAGYTFSGWSGDCSGTSPVYLLALNGVRTCGASFTPTSGGGSYSLTITPVPAGGTVTGNGLTCGAGGAACAVTFASATTATLTATPASGYVFTSWGGACSGTSVTTSVLVDAVKACSATFTASGGGGGLPTGPPYTLTVTPPVGGQVRASGIRCGAGATQCAVTMPAALSVGLEAVPSAGYTFSGWSGDCSGTAPTYLLALNGARTCGASFTPTGGGGSYSLTIAPTPTGGSVSGSGLACGAGGSACAVTFGSATPATLTATPASGYVFTSWGGNCAGTSATTAVQVDAVKTCSATFTATGGGPVTGPPYTLTVTPAAGGVIRAAGIVCGAGGTACTVTMPAALSLGLEAVASAGYTFSGWSGDCSGTSPAYLLALNGARTCSAVFTPVGGTPVYSMTISPVPVGGQVVGGGLTCGAGGSVCSVTRLSPTTMEVTAMPAAAYDFAGWSGDCSGTSRTVFVPLNGPRVCSASFTLK